MTKTCPSPGSLGPETDLAGFGDDKNVLLGPPLPPAGLKEKKSRGAHVGLRSRVCLMNATPLYRAITI